MKFYYLALNVFLMTFASSIFPRFAIAEEATPISSTYRAPRGVADLWQGKMQIGFDSMEKEILLTRKLPFNQIVSSPAGFVTCNILLLGGNVDELRISAKARLHVTDVHVRLENDPPAAPPTRMDTLDVELLKREQITDIEINAQPQIPTNPPVRVSVTCRALFGKYSKYSNDYFLMKLVEYLDSAGIALRTFDKAIRIQINDDGEGARLPEPPQKRGT